MRPLIGLVLVLGALFWWAVRADVAPPKPVVSDVVESPWRRTKDGWQRTDAWPDGTIDANPPAISQSFGRVPLPHPAIVALLLLLASLVFLVAGSEQA